MRVRGIRRAHGGSIMQCIPCPNKCALLKSSYFHGLGMIEEHRGGESFEDGFRRHAAGVGDVEFEGATEL